MDNISRSSTVSNTEEESLDPRVQIELEKLNNATDEINRLEATLEEANSSFRSSLNDTSNQLQNLAKRFGNCIEKSRPYYEAAEKAKKLQLDCQRAAIQYQRANAVHQAARETIALAEERFSNFRDNENLRERKFDSAWQEMLNHATMKIMEAEAQKSASEKEHLKIAAAYTAAEMEVQDLFRRFKSNINKSRPYFNYRTSTQLQLEVKKERIHKLQKEVSLAKHKYSLTLHNLEQISEEIHEHRRANMKREPGVGAETEPNETYTEGTFACNEAKDNREHEYWKELKNKFEELKEEDRQDLNDPSGSHSRPNDISLHPPIDKLSMAYGPNLQTNNQLQPEKELTILDKKSEVSQGKIVHPLQNNSVTSQTDKKNLEAVDKSTCKDANNSVVQQNDNSELNLSNGNVNTSEPIEENSTSNQDCSNDIKTKLKKYQSEIKMVIVEKSIQTTPLEERSSYVEGQEENHCKVLTEELTEIHDTDASAPIV